MARLHEYRGKELLARHGLAIPRGRSCTTPEQARATAHEIGGEVAVKAQVWTTARASMGGIRFAASPDAAARATAAILGQKVKGFTIDVVLVEEKLRIERELFASVIVDDAARRPVMLFATVGGTGIEEIARDHPDKIAKTPIDIGEGLQEHQARNLVRRAGLSGQLQLDVAQALVRLWEAARSVEARAAEVNPLVVTKDGRVVAADCRLTVDDYAVFRHPELGIEIARELSRPPTALDRIAYAVEAKDYRGTFYFIQMEDGFSRGERYVGFHGAGGGGSMMSMDAVLQRGFKIANFCDTSGNPPASKVYRAARIILSQPHIDAYFGSGSGVASQEQFHSARGLVKAFLEDDLHIPAVIRLGGNQEEKAIQILTDYTRDLRVPVEAYGKDDSANKCAERLQELVATTPRPPRRPRAARPPAKEPYEFQTVTGRIVYDHAVCLECESKVCVQACVPQILKVENGKPVLAVSREEAKRGKCTECLACEVECRFHGKGAGHVELLIPGLEDYRRSQGVV
ncbi:MAG: ATP-grasp domain-containing protein [Planctomycetota bacterium]